MVLKELDLYYHLFIVCGFWYPVPKDFYSSVAFIAQIIRNLLFILPWFVCIVSIYFEGFKQSMSGTAFFFVIGLINNVNLIIFYFKRYDTHLIMNIIKRSVNSHSTMWEQEFIRNRVAILFKLVKIYILIMGSFTVIVYMIVPMLNAILENFDIKTMKIPLPFRGFSQGKLKKDNFDRFLEFGGLMWCYLGIMFYVSVQLAFFFFTHYTSTEAELVCEKIKRLRFVHDERNFLSDKMSKTPDIITLREIILHHQFVLKLSREIINYFGLSMAVQNNIGALCICLTLISALSELHRDRSVVVVSVMITFCMVAQMFSICYFGHYLVEQSNMIHKRLYQLPWYRLTPPTRKGLIMIFMQAVKPIELNYHGVARINLRTFMQAINAAYSYFTLLKSTIDE